MPTLDVTDVLDDPDFVSMITVTRLVETPAGHGRATITPTVTPNVPAVVTAGSGDVMKYFPELAMVAGTVLVHTRFRLTTTSETTQADVITYLGRDYIVSGLNDWSTFGSGFVIAACTLKNLVEAAP
jgi:hypothetical protein